MIREANLAAASLLGVSRAELLGRRLGTFLAPGGLSPFADFLANVAAGHRGLTCDMSLPREDGGSAYVQLSGEAVETVPGCRFAMIDMTDRRRAEDFVLRWSGDLQKENERLRSEALASQAANEAIELLDEQLALQLRQALEANSELDAFSHSVSHDLRSPLRAIDAFTSRLQERSGDVLDEESKRLLGVVRASTLQVAALVDDLLAYLRVGRCELRIGPVDMESLARKAFLELLPDPDARGRVEFECGPLPFARGDAPLLKIVWSNLLGNAVKYSARQERPVVRVSSEVDGDRAVYRVSDNGIGFDMASVGKLFGVFQRLHGPDEFEGTGIGLALVRRVVDRLGGGVAAEGAMGKGATFTFWLPAV
jgi:PAS domain S-box-containing protein